MGIAENTGEALTFLILTEETNTIIAQSVVRSACNKNDINKRLENPFEGRSDTAYTTPKKK